MMLVLAACHGSLDGFYFDPEKVEEYDLPTDEIPEAAIERVSFPSTDGTLLYGVWIHQDHPAPPLLFFHGNDSNLSVYWDRMAYLRTWGYDVLIFDYRGYGKSEGECTHDGILEEDGLAAARYVADTTGVPPEETVWWGHSLGGAVAIHTADEIGPAAIVIESTFSKADDLVDDGVGLDLPAGWLFEDPFDNVAAIAEIQSPILVVHGLEDDFIRPAYAEELYAAAPDPKAIWQPDGCGHSDCPEVFPDEFRDHAVGWYTDFGVPPAP